MPRKPHKYHYLYKTTNLINNKFYVGMHSTSDLNDGYLGSGIYLRRSMIKYGKENFKFEILEFFDSRDILIEKEKELVNKDFIKEQLCMNLNTGGHGGFNSETSAKGGAAFQKKIRENPELKKDWLAKVFKNGNPLKCDWNGRKHKNETIIKMKQSHKGKHRGEKNSQFGTCWITKDKKNKKIKKEDLKKWGDLGWKNGLYRNK